MNHSTYAVTFKRKQWHPFSTKKKPEQNRNKMGNENKKKIRAAVLYFFLFAVFNKGYPVAKIQGKNTITPAGGLRHDGAALSCSTKLERWM